MLLKIFLIFIYTNTIFFTVFMIYIISVIFIYFKKKEYFKLSIKFIIIFVILFGYYLFSIISFNPQDMTIIAHAGGSIESKSILYSNSKEGFLNHYNKGTDIFEFDFLITSDGHLVAAHLFDDELYNDTNGDSAPTLEEFSNYLIHDEFHTLTLEDISQLMDTYDDFKIVVDTKEEDYLLVYDLIIATLDNDKLDRVIPQLYFKTMYLELEQKHSFKEYWFTLYLTEDSLKNIITFSEERDKISSIVINQYKFIDMSIYNLLEETILNIYAHTVNSEIYCFFLNKIGVDGIYSDYINND